MSKKKKRIYKGHFDIAHMVDYAREHHITFVIAVSEDKQRGAGKTYSTAKYLYNRYLDYGERFLIFVREVNELGHQAEGCLGMFFSDNYPDITVYEKVQDKNFSFIYTSTGSGKERHEECIGVVAPLKKADRIKNYRGLLQGINIRNFWFDEFQISGRYLPNETGPHGLMKKIVDTVNGNIDDLPIILTSNTIQIQNPYFKMLKLSGKLQSNTRSLITDTCVYENVTVEGLAEKHMNSAINKAFGADDEKYASNAWLGDNNSLVCKPDKWGAPFYICAIVYEDTYYGVYSYPNVGYYYISTNWDKSYDYVYALTLDGDLNIPLLKTNRTVCNLRDWFYSGRVRCANGAIQRMLLDVFGSV